MSNIFFDNWNKPWKELDFQDERLDAPELAEDTVETYVNKTSQNV